MTPSTIAALSVAIIYVFVAMFQLALALGAPMGEYAFGGQNPGKLPVGFRVAAVASLLLNLGIAGHYLAQAGAFTQLLIPELNALANWALVGFAGLGVVLNSISRSKKERQMWVPVAVLMLICAVVVALG